ncbi:exodeoxyribonuclease V subunit alpha [Xanthomonas arboricola]|uniref:RecBCD enzyme subunit RecD n=3 Tax=Xanthomonas arboricola TaxID=56448 RepID=A0AAQ0W318_9XANT|nr:exodeoxyribonuclease V subunit alpha [Xanthomonas arboricola]KCX00703.1 exodeoxyribonuclease V subunit alpha [Xanthomonas arboricola pv. pruni]MDN0265424.1 exodeoxyribonuclease V subunit alpha [Xanthomonas arboricola pv. pruni]MDN0269291.1 exodeoxyribonuclease V subunit alpha [Xanthomonas arboricola pv. pruni]MDN0273332.1 exodeoxyribonuclease V subunit alpha [Xanthomonas arboricola pv. pruni]MDN0281731.1 exodeoxyribonuclease V subunit alpha [Xanthomonas arboricola pv. pruni]
MNHPTLFNALIKADALRPLDLAFAQSLQRLAPDTDPQVLAGAALASLAVTSGHAGLDPSRAGMLLDTREGPAPALPDPTDWQRTLAASRWVDQPNPQDPAAADCPLVLERDLLYLRRYREYERRLALGLQRIAAQSPPPFDAATLAPLFAQLFPQASSLPMGEGARRAGEGTGLPEPSVDQEGAAPLAPSHHPDRQAQAAALALRRTLLLVTGGPGTGKTTTIARLLLLRIAQAHASNTPAPRIALAAPTGRAAERMAESLRLAVTRAIAGGIDPALADALPSGASTLHRLLGVIPDSPHFRHHADNPLPLDLIVVDEASMVDLPLMCKLVEAVADGTQLILLGDADQLPSVEAGDVLAAILQAAGPGDALQPQDAQALQALLGNAPGDTTPTASHGGGLAGHRVHLLRGYRQADDFALAPLAAAVRAGDADTALALLRSGELAGVHFHEDGEDPLTLGRDALLAHWRALADAQDPAAALRAAARLRLLTAVRAGPQGARGLNARIEQLLAETGSGARRLGAASPWFQGRLLLITENSYRHGLFNGDVGICLRSDASPSSGRSDEGASSGPGQSGGTDSRAQGPLVAWFEGDGDGQVRGFHPAALPAHESAFAMTVHKAQGSEFDTVWLQLPTRDARVLSRELLYTGITRARRALHLAGSEAVIRSALARHAARISGLAWRLGAQQQAAPAKPATEPSTALPVQGSLF